MRARPRCERCGEGRSSTRWRTEPREIRLILVIDLDAEPINGSLETPDGRSRGFLGWIGLAATLNAIREADAEDT